MINLSFSNGTVLVFNVDDWFELRTKHRIVGEFVGISKISAEALPLILSPEEVTLLVKKQIANLVEWKQLKHVPSDADRETFEEKLKILYEEQKIVHFEGKRHLLKTYADEIVCGKKKKNEEISSNEAIESELDKGDHLQEENIVFPIYTQHPEYLKGAPTPVSLCAIERRTTELKCAVYEDLWNKGHFITNALKFGGDFLVYLGDPVTFHAVYIVKCVEDRKQLHNVTEIIECGRLGNSVCKRYVLASFNSDKSISYITISYWD